MSRLPESAPRTWAPAYVGIGGNLDDPVLRVRRAASALHALPATRLVQLSRLYRNPPLGGMPQPDFVNAVAGILTMLEPLQLLEQLHALERAQGRHRAPGEHWAPRTLDLDLLVFGERVLRTDRITVPHPGIPARNFVLFPLLEIAPELRVPGAGLVAHLARAVSPAGLVPLD